MEHKATCYICEEEGTEANSIVCDGLCERTMHAKCVGMNKTVCKAYGELDNLYYMCNECIEGSLKAVNIKLNKILSFMQIYDERVSRHETQISEVKRCVTEMKSEFYERVESNSDLNSKGSITVDESFVVNKVKSRKAKTKSKSTIVFVKPKNGQSCEMTEKDFKNHIDPSQVQVNRLRKGPKGGLAVVCESQVESDKLEKIATDKLGDNYVIEPQKVQKVELKIVDIGENLTEEELMLALKKQNEQIASREINLLSFYEVKHSKSFSAIIEVDGETSDMLLDKGFLKVSFSRCRVFEHVKMSRCYKCQGYNHKASECKNNRACKKCAGDHDMKDCTSDKFMCVNCKVANEKFSLNLNVNHRVSSMKCTVLNKKMKAKKGRFQYTK